MFPIARTFSRQHGATDLGNVWIYSGKVIGRAVELAVVAACIDEGLALRRKLLEYRVVTRRIFRIPAPVITGGTGGRAQAQRCLVGDR